MTLEPREYETGIATLIVINRELVEIHSYRASCSIRSQWPKCRTSAVK